MKENDWTKSLCEIIKARSIGENIHIDVFQKIPYAFEVSVFDEDWKVDEESLCETSFETDLVVYEKLDKKLFLV